MKTIHKHVLTIEDRQLIKTYYEAKILKVAYQTNDLCLWLAVDDDKTLIKRVIYIRGTGHDLQNVPVNGYIDSVQSGSFVWHIFDGGEI